MTAQQTLKQQFFMFYRMVEANLSDMTAEQSLATPDAGGNSANWILGHVINVHNAAMGLIGEAPVWASKSLESVTTDPSTLPEGGVDWEEMKSHLMASEGRCLAAIESLSDERMSETVPHPFGGDTTVAELLGILAFHQAYHSGQFGITRRVAGLEGAVLGPGQER